MADRLGWIRSGQHGVHLWTTRVSEHEAHEEPVALTVGKRRGAGGVERILGGEHEEGFGQGASDAVHAHLALLHRLEECGLGPRRGPIELVGHEDVGEHRSGSKPGFVPSGPSTVAPTTSPGSRSAVHWRRWNWSPSAPARALARVVLPSPGWSSTRRWPPPARQATARRMVEGVVATTAATASPGQRTWRWPRSRPGGGHLLIRLGHRGLLFSSARCPPPRPCEQVQHPPTGTRIGQPTGSDASDGTGRRCPWFPYPPGGRPERLSAWPARGSDRFATTWPPLSRWPGLADSAGGTIAPDLLAPALGYSGTNNGAYLSRVASARLFGVVTGRGPRLELTERGRQILAGVSLIRRLARREAFLAVPLFRAVADAAESRAGRLPDDLARLAGRRVRGGGGQGPIGSRPAGRVCRSSGADSTMEGETPAHDLVTDFTPVDNRASIVRVPQLGWRRGTVAHRGRTVAMAEDGLWLDEEPDRGSNEAPAWRRAGSRRPAAAVLVVVAVPVALVAGGSTSKPTAAHTSGSIPKSGTARLSTRCCLRSVPPLTAAASTSPMPSPAPLPRAPHRRRRRRPSARR